MEFPKPHPNRQLIDTFQQAFARRDFTKIREVMSKKVTWTFAGQHPLAGVKTGVDEVVEFLEALGGILGTSKLRSKKLIIAENDKYVLEYQRIRTRREDHNNIDQDICICWTIKKGKIVSGKHLFSDLPAIELFFNRLAGK